MEINVSKENLRGEGTESDKSVPVHVFGQG